VLTDKAQAFSWGFGDSGALGHAGDDDELTPRLIDLAKNAVGQATALQITGGGQHSMLLARVLD
jgi:alpha-tubulin suppressor-like RCC1 family protein